MKQIDFLGALRRSRKTILCVAVTAMITLAAVLLAQSWLNPHGPIHFPSTGTLTTVNVKAYWDEGQLNETKEISWGTIHPGSSYNITLFLQSLSNVPTTFKLTTENWTFWNSHGAIVLGPINETPYMNLTWNHVDRNIDPKETVRVTLTLAVTGSSDFVSFLINDDVREFGVDISIRAIESS